MTSIREIPVGKGECIRFIAGSRDKSRTVNYRVGLLERPVVGERVKYVRLKPEATSAIDESEVAAAEAGGVLSLKYKE